MFQSIRVENLLNQLSDSTSAISENEADYISQNDCKENFAKILQIEIMTSESNALIDSEFISIPSEEPTIFGLSAPAVHEAEGCEELQAPLQAPLRGTKQSKQSKQSNLAERSEHTSRQAGKPPKPKAEGAGRSEQVLLMPYLQPLMAIHEVPTPTSQYIGEGTADPELVEGEQNMTPLESSTVWKKTSFHQLLRTLGLSNGVTPLENSTVGEKDELPSQPGNLGLSNGVTTKQSKMQSAAFLSEPQLQPQAIVATSNHKTKSLVNEVNIHQPLTKSEEMSPAFAGRTRSQRFAFEQSEGPVLERIEPKAEGPDSRDSAQFIPLAGRNVGEPFASLEGKLREQLWQAPRGEYRVAILTEPITRNHEQNPLETWTLFNSEGNTVKVSNGETNLSDVLPTDVITQIGDEIQVNLKMLINPDLSGGRQELRVQLKPEHLGSITLKVSMVEGVLSVDISTENTAVKSIIESHLHDLRQNLLQRGIEVGRFNISAEPTPYPLQGRGESDNMSQFGSQGGMFSSYSSDSRRNARQSRSWEELGVGSQQSLLLYPEDETLEQKNWFLKQTMVDIWM